MKSSIREMVLAYVENNGPASWTKLHEIVLVASGRPISEKVSNHWGIAYLDNVSAGQTAFLPTESDSRYLVKSRVDGLYHMVYE